MLSLDLPFIISRLLVLCRRFLNRLLGLPAARQNLLFNYFACTLAAEIRAAKAEGKYFEGVSDLGGSHVSKVEPQVGIVPGAHVCLMHCFRSDFIASKRSKHAIIISSPLLRAMHQRFTNQKYLCSQGYTLPRLCLKSFLAAVVSDCLSRCYGWTPTAA